MADSTIWRRVGEEPGFMYWRGDELIDGRCAGIQEREHINTTPTDTETTQIGEHRRHREKESTQKHKGTKSMYHLFFSYSVGNPKSCMYRGYKHNVAMDTVS